MKENKSFDGTLLMSPNRLGSIEICSESPTGSCLRSASICMYIHVSCIILEAWSNMIRYREEM